MVKSTLKRLEDRRNLIEAQLEAERQRILKNQRDLISRNKPKKRKGKALHGPMFDMDIL